MSIKSKFSPLGYLFPKIPKIKLTIVCNIVCDNIYLNGVSVAQNVSQIENLEVNKGLLCNIKFEASGYDSLILEPQVIYEDTTIEGYIGATDTLILNINSGDEGEFYIPLNHYRQVNYNWNIKWGDGTPTQNVTGIYSSSNTGILHEYPNKNTNYTITITRNQASNYNGWLLAFGFDTTTTNYGPHSLINKGKIYLVDGELTESMFYDIMRPAGRTPVDMSQNDYKYAYMFNDCRNLQLGNSISMPRHYNINKSGTHYCENMFLNCTSLTSLKNFQFDGEHIEASDYYCNSMFQGCINLVDIGNFSIGTYDDDGTMYQGPQIAGTYMCANMFRNCQSLISLQNFVLSDSLSVLGDYSLSNMFNNCKLLNDVSDFNFPRYMTTAPRSAFAYKIFYDCQSLEDLGNMKIPNITSINNSTESEITDNNESSWIGYFESAFENCISLKTGYTSFLSNWTNATQAMIDYHWYYYVVIPYAAIKVLVYYRTFYKMFKNCTSIEEILTTNIKPLSFTPTRSSDQNEPYSYYIEKQTFRGCPSEYVSQLNANWL